MVEEDGDVSSWLSVQSVNPMLLCERERSIRFRHLSPIEPESIYLTYSTSRLAYLRQIPAYHHQCIHSQVTTYPHYLFFSHGLRSWGRLCIRICCAPRSFSISILSHLYDCCMVFWGQESLVDVLNSQATFAECMYLGMISSETLLRPGVIAAWWHCCCCAHK